MEGLYCSESPELGDGGGGEGGVGSGGPRELRVVQLRGVAGKALGVLLARYVELSLPIYIFTSTDPTLSIQGPLGFPQLCWISSRSHH